MTLTKEEFDFIKKQTKLSKEQLSLLLTDERDFDLVLESISKIKIQKKRLAQELSKFTFPFCIKYLFYTNNKETCDISTLSYVAQSIIEIAPEVQKTRAFRQVPGKVNEYFGKYCMVVSGLFRAEMIEAKFDPKKYISWASKCFDKINGLKNVEKWSDNLYDFSLKNLSF